jgi:hypothetical protein
MAAAGGACRVCMEECEEKLGCSCNGFAHAACIREWIKARIQRGDTVEDAMYCELCRSRIITFKQPLCSWLRFRILALVFIILAFMVSIYSIILISPSSWDSMVVVIVLAVFLALFAIVRVLIDHRCIHACLCHDLQYLGDAVQEPVAPSLPPQLPHAITLSASPADGDL